MKTEEIGYAWNFTADLGSGRQFSLSGNFKEGLDADSMNAEVDKVRSVFDRQQAKSAARNLEEEIDRLAGQKKQVIDTIGRLDSKTESKGGPSSAERSQRDAALINLESLTTNIESKQKLLTKLNNESK